MIPNAAERTLVSAGTSASKQFEISKNDEAHLMMILRDTLYSDEILAVIREYCSNAWDAHRVAGKSDVPIKVTVPTSSELVFRVRDFGHGLSPDQIFNIYSQYGASTKREDAGAVGMLGIGSKSGFAYSDTFTVTSWNGGKKRVYIAVIDASNKGLINLAYEQDCGDETGIEIQIPVHSDDLFDFRNRCERFFQFFNPKPDINISIPVEDADVVMTPTGYLRRNGGYGRGDWVAVMGCVPYKVDRSQLKGDYATPHADLSGVLFFNVGDVEISASREELKYTDRTKEAVVNHIDATVDESIRKILEDLKKLDLNMWEKRLKARSLTDLGLKDGLENESLGVFAPIVKFTSKPPPTFAMTSGKWNNDATGVTVKASTCIYLRDDDRALRGYRLDSSDIVVRRKVKNWDVVRADLDKFLKEQKLDGIPIKQISSNAWTQSSRKPMREGRRIGHSQRVFEYTNPLSVVERDRWSPVEAGAPTPEDMYIVIQQFVGVGGDHEPSFSAICSFLKEVGVAVPKLYGYRQTPTRPVTQDSLVGIPYKKWISDAVGKFANSNPGTYLRCLMTEFGDPDSYPELLKEVESEFGEGHDLSEVFRSLNSTRNINKFWPAHSLIMEILEDANFSNPTLLLYRKCLKKYPLFEGRFSLLFSGIHGAYGRGRHRMYEVHDSEGEQGARLWRTYVKQMDRLEELTK